VTGGDLVCKFISQIISTAILHRRQRDERSMKSLRQIFASGCRDIGVGHSRKIRSAADISFCDAHSVRDRG